MTALDVLGRPVSVGRAVFRTPGLTGEVSVSPPDGQGGFRSAETVDELLREALRREDVDAAETYVIAGARERDLGSAPTRSSDGEPAVVLELPAPAEGWQQVILASDEAGVLSWHVPEGTTGPGGEATRGSGATQTFVLRRTVPPPDADDAPPTRGLIAAVGRKVLQVLVFRGVEAAGGVAGAWAAGRWEKEHRPYRLRTFEPGSATTADGAEVDGAWWAGRSPGPTLLMVHGTFSRAHSGFAGLPETVVGELNDRYEGRVIALDHPSLSVDPAQNVDELLRRLPAEVDLELDVVAHSRGGLVARALGARQGDLSVGGQRLRLRHVVFVATPNAGTVLADGKHMGRLVDRYTNLLALLPDTVVLDVLQAVVDVVKHLAVGAVDALPGLAAMRPEGRFLADLQATPLPPEARPHVMSADYEPATAGRVALAAYARDTLMDRVFGKDANDLVVPTAGVASLGKGVRLPPEDRLSFVTTDAVDHSAFFGHRVAQERLLAWLAS